MAEQKESSVLFSLKELMNLEEDRIKSEEDAKVAAQRQAQERAAAAERAKREAEEARIRAEEDARRQEEQRKREEEARLEAIRQGEIEKARAEAEHRARMEALAAQQAHEQQLAAMQGNKSQKKLKVIIGVVVGVFLVGAIGGGIIYKKNVEEAEKASILAKQQAQAAEEQRLALQRKLEEMDQQSKELTRKLSEAKDDVTRQQLQRQMDDLKDKKNQINSGGGRARPSGGGEKPAGKPCACPPGDPLCSCL